MSILNPLQGRTTLTYDTHGNLVKKTDANNNTTTYELYYYRARYYDTGIQRFLSRDPIGFSSGDFNFYRYVGNSPVSFVDPFGLEQISQYLRQTQKKNNDAVNRLVPLYNDKEAYKKEFGNILNDYGDSFRNNNNGYTFSEREINLYQQRASASLQQQVPPPIKTEQKAEGLGLSGDVEFLDFIEVTGEAGYFQGIVKERGKFKYVCGGYLSGATGLKLDKDNLPILKESSMDDTNNRPKKGIKGRISGGVTYVEADEGVSPFDMFTGTSIQETCVYSPFAFADFYTDRDKDGKISRNDIDHTGGSFDIAWPPSWGCSTKIVQGTVFNVKQSNDGKQTW